MPDLRAHLVGILSFLGSFWPGWIIIFGLILVAYGVVAWRYSDSVTELLRRSRNPSLSEETSRGVYTSDHTRVVATAVEIVGLVVTVVGVIATVFSYAP